MRYFVGFLMTVGLIIVLILLLFRGDSKPKVALTSKTLDSYASTSAEVRLTIDGPINAQSQHNQARISVDHNNVTFEYLNGYNGDVLNMQRYPNTKESYAVFLRALTHAGFTLGDTDKKLSDERGYCPLSNRYIFELTQDNKTLERFWTTSCGKPKSFLGNSSLVVSLFEAQVPNYSELTQDSGL